MTTYAVTVVRTITTTLTVNTSSAAEARRKIEEYGIELAWSDFPARDEQDKTRISSVEKVCP